MKVTVRVSKSFKRQAKPLLKKFPSLSGELVQLENELIENPKIGKQIGQNLYKIRIAVKSKRKGKSGGLRIISHLDKEIFGIVESEGEQTTVSLISIYDKSETATISDKELKELIDKLQDE
jgi:mRNA-degrading endonuclease RelE of RelBE toxin-antitoxin system